MKKQIQWESRHMVYDAKLGKLVKGLEDKEEDNDWSKDKDGIAGLLDDIDIPVKKLGFGPFGNTLYDLDDSAHILKNFSFYLGHTNFNVSEEVIQTILDIDGVEVLLPVTRYRFLIAFGQLFNMTDVKLSIQSALCDEPLINMKTSMIKDPDIREEVINMAEELDELGTNYAILVMPNGQTSFSIQSDQVDTEHEKTLREYFECAKECGAIVIQN